jgi:hypothetical protein
MALFVSGAILFPVQDCRWLLNGSLLTGEYHDLITATMCSIHCSDRHGTCNHFQGVCCNRLTLGAAQIPCLPQGDVLFSR